MNYEKGEFLYEGKAKKIFSIKNHEDLVWLSFKDSLTAFNGVKKGSFEGKGHLNHQVASLIFRYLSKNGVETHWESDPEVGSMVCKKVTIIPLEVVVRNRLAGSTAKKLGIEEGRSLKKPLVEFYYKDDDLQDPFLSDDQALLLEVVPDQKDLEILKKEALRIDALLQEFFKAAGIELIDFKLEFGRDPQGKFYLADEITPDSCRLWDYETGERLDKDRFRRDLGQVEENYQMVWERIKKEWESKI